MFGLAGLMYVAPNSYDEEYIAMCAMSYRFNDGMQGLLLNMRK